MNAERRPGGGVSRVLVAIAVVIALLTGAFLATVYTVVVVIPKKAAEAAGEVAAGGVDSLLSLVDKLKKELGVTPRITIDSRIVAEPARDILQLATVEQRFTVRHTYAHTWLGSTKEIELEGTFIAKAGFDLDEEFQIDLTSAEKGPPQISVAMGDPVLISLEQREISIEGETEGWWNRIDSTDRERALNALSRAARQEVAQSNLLAAARESLERRIEGIVVDHFAPVEFRRLGVETPVPAPRSEPTQLIE